MPRQLHQALLALLIAALLLVSSSAQRALNRDRLTLDVGRGEALGQTAPPVLVFSTVALGGFRGLIANALWIRMNDLQEQDKFFEKVQLADWITKLQPRTTTVWIVQAWDMAYNISVKFTDPNDRWTWVRRGIELLRDQAIRYNPDEPLLYRELAWFFQHKMGADLDDAHRTYKTEWAYEMQAVLGTNYLELLNPQTDDARARARALREHYKMDPAVMQEIDDTYGPLDWRLPEAHAVYWATMGFKNARRKDLVTLRRTIFQPLYLAFQRGRLIVTDSPQGRRYRFAPNLAMIPRANAAYLTSIAEDPDRDNQKNMRNAHRSFLKDAVYFLYTANRRPDAAQWYQYLLEQYPDAMSVDVRRQDKASVRLADLSVDDYAAAKVTEDIGETSNIRVTGNLLGLLISHFYYLAIDEEDTAIGSERIAQAAWQRYQREIQRSKQDKRVGLAPYDEIKSEAFRRFEEDYPDLTPQLRTRLGLPAPTPPAASTNALEGRAPVSP